MLRTTTSLSLKALLSPAHLPTSCIKMKYYLFDSRTCLAAVVFVILHCHGILAHDITSDRTIVNVDVYYESLCKDSIAFITTQLVPSYPDLKQNLHVTFIPYGKATHVRDKTGRWQFECQHGPNECYGNKAQACGIHAIQSSEEAENRQELTVKLVGCAMKNRNTTINVPNCAQQIGLREQTRALINECTGSSLGDDLLAANGDKTNTIQLPLKFVPTIVINRVYSQEKQDEALRNFPALICRHLPENEKPNLCSSVGERLK